MNENHENGKLWPPPPPPPDELYDDWQADGPAHQPLAYDYHRHEQGNSLDYDELVRSSQVPIDVPYKDVPFIEPITSDDAPKPLEVSTVVECLRLGEYGDALLFSGLYEGRVCYDHVEEQWYLWEGHYWAPDKDKQIKILVHGPLAAQYILAAGALKQQINTPREQNPVANLFPAEGDLSKQIEELVSQLWERSKKLRFKNRRHNILDIAGSLIFVNNEKWDANPWLLGCENGVLSLNLDDCWFRNGQPEDYIRTIAPTNWQGIECEQESLMTWFIPSLFDNRSELERDEITSYLRKLFGYGMTGLTREENFIILWGDEGRNGKDTLLRMIERTLGGEMACPVDKAVIVDGKKKAGGSAASHIMALRGKRIVWVNETKEGEILSTGQVKYLTGGGTITARELFQTQTTFEASHLLLLETNHKPHANADDKAIWERIALVPFELRFVAEPKAPNERPRNPKLKEPLTEEEKAGVLAYFVRGCIEWQRDGLIPPDCLKAAKLVYHEEEDTLGQFVKERCITGRQFRINAKALYEAYVEWAIDEGGKPMTNHTFGRKMQKRFKRKHTNRGKVYEGLKAKPTSPKLSDNEGIF